MKRSPAAIGTAALTSALTSLALVAVAPTAHAAPTTEVLASGLAGPLQFDVDGPGSAQRIVVAQSFAGLLSEVEADGSLTTLFASKTSEVAGVAIEGADVAFLTTRNSHANPGSFLKSVGADGAVDTVADLFAFEAEMNPDGDQKYGFKGLSRSCKRKLPRDAGLRPYSGIVESHPYGLADAPGGGWYVADAAANAILQVSPDGTIEVVSVLPSQDVFVTRAMAEATGLPGCVARHTFRFEPVPTDVEVDDGGQLVVSLLPGGPEDPSLGARGSVHRMDPATGEHTMLADGLAAATNVALDGDTVYVTELFANLITRVAPDGTKTTFAQKSMPSAVEWANGKLYATVGIFSDKGGKLIAMTPEPVS